MSASVIQNKILTGLIKEFEEDFGIKGGDEAKSFERLVNYVLLSKIDPEAFSEPAVFEQIDVDSNGTFGIDAFALLVNDNLIVNKDDIEHHQKTKRLDVKFVLIQSKRSTSVDTGDLLKFTAAVKNFFSDKPAIGLAEDLLEARDLVDEIFKHENARLFANRKPKLELYFATTGTAATDPTILGVIASEERNIHACVPEVQSVTLKHIHADYLIDLYSEIENRYSVTITFEKAIPCEKIEGVEQAYIGYLPAPEFLKLITGADGTLRKNLFYENVRDFQGADNSVNTEISETLSDSDMIDKFILLNNGITVVAREFSNLRSTEYEISDYYVVNGCQTSNMIYKNKGRVGDNPKLKIPIKFIHTTSNDLIAKIIRSTNRQTPVPDEAFVSLEKFHKRLQEFYRVYGKTAPESLYYERRSKEFTNTTAKIEKPRIVNLHAQIRSFASIILNEPQLVMSNNPSSILRAHSSRLFAEDQKYIVYYLASLLLYLFGKYHDDKIIDGKYTISRYWVCWIARVLAFGKIDLGPLNSSKVEKECDRVIDLLKSKDYVTQLFTEATRILEASKLSYISKNGKARNAELVRLKAFRDEVRAHLADKTKPFAAR
ncbi:AIPR family protein [Archangium violaceum]|uniref:AIPR family protein n=1 Tax=Archangium violaceum TaxID=83451 RepID=UPI0036DE95DD